MTTELFKLFDITCDTALSGRDAIRKCREIHYDIIYMDHMMPEMDGIETTQAIRAIGDEWLENIPIIALTANAIAGMKQVFLSSGMNAFIAKPVMLPEIEASLREFLPEQLIHETTRAQAPAAIAAIQLEPMDGIDTKQGITYCGGTLEGYMEVLRTFAASAPNQVEVIRRSIENSDIARVSLEAHSLKSASGGIGAAALSEKAKDIEMAGKNGDEIYVYENIESLLEDYNNIVDEIKSVFSDKPDMQKNEASTELIIETLKIVLTNAEDYDLTSANDAIDALDVYELPENVKTAVTSIRSAISVFSYANTINETYALLEELKKEG